MICSAFTNSSGNAKEVLSTLYCFQFYSLTAWSLYTIFYMISEILDLLPLKWPSKSFSVLLRLRHIFGYRIQFNEKLKLSGENSMQYHNNASKCTANISRVTFFLVGLCQLQQKKHKKKNILIISGILA